MARFRDIRFMDRYGAQAYALLRIVAGFMFSLHGAQKLFGFLSEQAVPAGSLPWLGGIIELVCGLCIMLGAFTRLAAFIASGEMAVAYFMVHWKLQFSRQFFPIANHGELAALYCFVFLYLSTQGSGLWSVDKNARH